MADHVEGKRKSTRAKHEEGSARNKTDAGNGKADEIWRPPRQRPPTWKGPWLQSYDVDKSEPAMSKYEDALALMEGEVTNTQEVIGLLFSATAEGDHRAQYALATWLLHGRRIAKDAKRGAQMLREAARHGNANAMFDLAVCYETGAGLEKNLEKAFAYYRRSAKAGDRQAGAEVGRMMYYGIGTAKDRGGAQKWLADREGEPAKLSA